MGMPMYSSTPFSPSMNDSFVSVAITPSSPLEYVAISCFLPPATAVVMLVSSP
jgi:hypothetical protein